MNRLAPIVLLLALLACEPAHPPAPARARAPAVPRVVSLGPNLTEIVLAVGGADRLVGVTDDCLLPEGLAHPPRRLGKYNTAPALEQMAALAPDLVLVPWESRPVVKRVQAMGLKATLVQTNRLDEIIDAVRVVGEAIGLKQRGARTAARLAARVEAVRRRTAGEPRPSVLLLLGRGDSGPSHLFAVGPGTFLDDLIVAAGGRNVLAGSPAAYPQVSAEEVLRLAPEVILEVAAPPMTIATPEEVRQAWQTLPGLPAVRDGRVHVLTDGRILMPGPSVVDTVETMAGLLHPGGANGAP